ncbi:MAG: flavodoxin domain-containing protein [Lachnospiraceae bacterium]|nr:flavodoxin domain-containing protein [Lachnospiraceae bacterium]MDD7379048.1 flavodoxin domain-containing protein [Lachnospiraceae bacterium]MDY4617531.1 flavodoxin domain-containing protein [Lachnospiraceae bacterium]MDY5774610.1 flavodoxin domain-containing protein [Lachnospiraceae bacterium]
MKRLVVYQSATGFTEKYATWIAEKLSCEAKELKGVKKQEIGNYDMIIFGGWIMGGMIMGLDKMQKMNPKQLVVFAVGASNDSEEVRENLKTQNHLEQSPLFYLEGGLAFERMSFFPKTILKKMGKSIAKKENKTPQEQEMEKLFAGSFDNSDITKIEPLVVAVEAATL